MMVLMKVLISLEKSTYKPAHNGIDLEKPLEQEKNGKLRCASSHIVRDNAYEESQYPTRR